ncbi:hypothetical protein [Kibdelosporangium philippinense]|uniref:hypothetical protein n=1 Tax=Kibdelosporangium philippinense TaxID=211113 RepID=UPI0036231BC3
MPKDHHSSSSARSCSGPIGSSSTITAKPVQDSNGRQHISGPAFRELGIQQAKWRFRVEDREETDPGKANSSAARQSPSESGSANDFSQGRPPA